PDRTSLEGKGGGTVRSTSCDLVQPGVVCRKSARRRGAWNNRRRAHAHKILTTAKPPKPKSQAQEDNRARRRTPTMIAASRRAAVAASRRAASSSRSRGRHRPLAALPSPSPSASCTSSPPPLPLRAMSSLHDPTLFPSLEEPHSGSVPPPASEDVHDDARLLRSDVRTMGALLGDAIALHHGEDVLEKVEKMRHMAKESRSVSGEQKDVDRLAPMVDFVRTLSAKELVVVSRAFAHFLGVANAAEAHHRCRRLKSDLEEEGRRGLLGALHETKRDSAAGVLARLASGADGAEKVSAKDLHASLCGQTVELVLTAHPTQVNRRTLLEKHGRVQRILNDADALRESGTPYAKGLLEDALRREIASIWQTDEVSRVKPSPQSEAERGTLVLETVVWEVLPSFLRKLDASMRDRLGEEYGLPLDARPFKFASWMGGDRDGNPNVTPDVTREVCLANRIKAAALLEKDVRELIGLISGNPPRGMDDACRFESEAMKKVRERAGTDSRAPFRAYLYPVAKKLAKTAEWAGQELARVRKKAGGEATAVAPSGVPTSGVSPEEVYLSKDELMEELLTVHRSLCDTGNAVVANGRLADVIRKVSAFGLTLVPLDVRQESDRHAEALDCITRYLGLGSYSQWDEGARVNWIVRQLQSKRPLLRQGAWDEAGSDEFFTPTARDTLGTFEMIAEQEEASLGAYVISQCTSASDILAVLLLQMDAGVEKPLRVVPLFETLDDLNGAAATMDQLFNIPAYVGSLEGRRQEVMIGYSGSAKDA
ncbi:hypothetical protein ACHAWF_018948, partial [Thalassiosira exigua]